MGQSDLSIPTFYVFHLPFYLVFAPLQARVRDRASGVDGFRLVF